MKKWLQSHRQYSRSLCWSKKRKTSLFSRKEINLSVELCVATLFIPFRGSSMPEFTLTDLFSLKKSCWSYTITLRLTRTQSLRLGKSKGNVKRDCLSFLLMTQRPFTLLTMWQLLHRLGCYLVHNHLTTTDFSSSLKMHSLAIGISQARLCYCPKPLSCIHPVLHCSANNYHWVPSRQEPFLSARCTKPREHC